MLWLGAGTRRMVEEAGYGARGYSANNSVEVNNDGAQGGA